MTGAFLVRDGLATLGPELVRIRDLLEERFLSWASECGADLMVFPPLISKTDLETFDYFDNFPHLALMTAPLRVDGGVRQPGDGPAVSAEHLQDSEYGLPSAACYNVYLHLRGTRLDAPRYVTTVASCFRAEDRYEGLRRLRGFTMREIVCVGSDESVRDHIAACRSRIGEFASALGLRLEIQPADDPFFEATGARALLQKLFPVKEEFVHDGSLAIASMNFHRNFFGERAGITLPGDVAAFSGCVAFGLERWLAALLETHGDAGAVLATLERLGT